jgi:hypothetical protein
MGGKEAPYETDRYLARCNRHRSLTIPAYPFSSFFSSSRKRQSVPEARIF